MTSSDREEFLRRMRTPALSFAALAALLGVNVLLGATMPFRSVWIAELAVAAGMAAVVLLLSMEILRAPPLIRLFSVLGFCWLTILIGMTLIDYMTRAVY